MVKRLIEGAHCAVAVFQLISLDQPRGIGVVGTLALIGAQPSELLEHFDARPPALCFLVNFEEPDQDLMALRDQLECTEPSGDRLCGDREPRGVEISKLPVELEAAQGVFLLFRDRLDEAREGVPALAPVEEGPDPLEGFPMFWNNLKELMVELSRAGLFLKMLFVAPPEEKERLGERLRRGLSSD